MGGYLLPKAQVVERIDYVLQTFPSLRPLLKRSGKLLSGGERKLLGIGRSLISSPKLLILDEPTAGLSPSLARGILDDHVTSLTRAGVTILLVEQRAHQAMQIADWCYVLVAGRVELNDAPAALLARPDFGQLFLGRSARTRRQPRRAGTCPRPLPARPSPPPARTRPVTMRADRGRPGGPARPRGQPCNFAHVNCGAPLVQDPHDLPAPCEGFPELTSAGNARTPILIPGSAQLTSKSNELIIGIWLPA